MQDQWASLIVPGQKVRVKFISKLSSFDCFATAKVDLRLADSDQLLRECQFRDLCF